MRSMMRAALVAVAVVCVVSAAPAFAQAGKKAPVTVVALPLTKVPANVLNVFNKAFPGAKVTKVEQLGKGKTATYHFFMTDAKAPEVKVTAAGKLIRK